MALLAPTVHTFIMNRHLGMISAHVGPGVHVVLVPDQAGWHRSRRLEVPGNITLLPLPPYSPELNPVERVWSWLKSHHLSNRVFDDSEDLLESGTLAWNTLTRQRLRTLCRTTWITREY